MDDREKIAYLLELAESHFNDGNLSAAISAWQQVLQVDKGNDADVTRAARVLLAQGEALFFIAERKRKEAQAEHELRDSFMSAEVPPDAASRVAAMVRRAAEAGQREVLVLRFPATFCNDHGRAINNLAPDWPDSLEGEAKRARAWFEEHLAPLGFKVRAQILNYPDGIPGEVGIFLRW